MVPTVPHVRSRARPDRPSMEAAGPTAPLSAGHRTAPAATFVIVATASSTSAADQQQHSRRASAPLIKLLSLVRTSRTASPSCAHHARARYLRARPYDLTCRSKLFPTPTSASVTLFSPGDPQVVELKSFPATVHVTVPIERLEISRS